MHGTERGRQRVDVGFGPVVARVGGRLGGGRGVDRDHPRGDRPSDALVQVVDGPRPGGRDRRAAHGHRLDRRTPPPLAPAREHERVTGRVQARHLALAEGVGQEHQVRDPGRVVPQRDQVLGRLGRDLLQRGGPPAGSGLDHERHVVVRRERPAPGVEQHVPALSAGPLEHRQDDRAVHVGHRTGRGVGIQACQLDRRGDHGDPLGIDAGVDQGVAVVGRGHPQKIHLPEARHPRRRWRRRLEHRAPHPHTPRRVRVEPAGRPVLDRRVDPVQVRRRQIRQALDLGAGGAARAALGGRVEAQRGTGTRERAQEHPGLRVLRRVAGDGSSPEDAGRGGDRVGRHAVTIGPAGAALSDHDPRPPRNDARPA